MNSQYHQITQSERYHIQVRHEQQMSNSSTAKFLGRSPSTISRELKRNRTEQGCYCGEFAHEISTQRRKSADKFTFLSDTWIERIRTFLNMSWTLDGLADRLATGLESCEQVSKTTLYRWVNRDRKNGGTLYKLLPRQGRKRRSKPNRGAGLKHIPHRIDINQRPAIIDQRARLGDFEGDTIHGKNGSLVTLTDRRSRLALIGKVPNRDKETVSDMMIKLLGQLRHCHSLTLDNGGEFAGHSKITEETGVDVYFAKPYASWQRGTNENFNGLERRIWPKKTNFSEISDKHIWQVQTLLNFRPMKVLGGLTPVEVYTGRRVALIS
jgi:IS30 family transposase